MTTTLEGLSGQRHAPATLYPRDIPGTHCTGGWVGPRAGLDRRGKSLPTWIFLNCKICTLLFFEVYVIVPLYTCFVLWLIGCPMSSLIGWGLGGPFGLPPDPCVCTLCVWLVVLIFSSWLFVI